MKAFRIQPARHTDHITTDGTELTKLPYPFIVQADGKILNSDVLGGNPITVVGFQNDLSRQQVDLWFRDAVRMEMQTVVGKYLITRDDKGNLASQVCAVSEVTLIQD